MKIKVNILLIITFMTLSLKSNSCYAQKFSKQENKAAFVYNFIQFVTWPAEKTTLTLGIIGNNEFTSILKSKLANQKIGNRGIIIIHYPDNQTQFKCDVIFIANDSKLNIAIILDEIKNKSILSIGELDGFCLKGGIINFVEGDNGNYFFEINKIRATEEKIIISSKLLKLALK